VTGVGVGGGGFDTEEPPPQPVIRAKIITNKNSRVARTILLGRQRMKSDESFKTALSYRTQPGQCGM
jgi:hypothetical protein